MLLPKMGIIYLIVKRQGERKKIKKEIEKVCMGAGGTGGD